MFRLYFVGAQGSQIVSSCDLMRDDNFQSLVDYSDQLSGNV